MRAASGVVAARTVAYCAAAAYLAFLVLWGFNYRRIRLVELLPFEAARVTPESVTRAAGMAADRANAQRRRARAGDRSGSGGADPTIAVALDRALADIGRRASRPPRPAEAVHARPASSSAPASTA